MKHIEMKKILSFLFILLNLIGFGQEKNCNTVNIPGKRCEVQIISQNNDTIICIAGNDCYTLEYDLSKNVTWIAYFEDTLKIREIISYQNGLQTKKHTQYFSNGKLKHQSIYENGELIGPYLSFYENGSIYCSGMYVNGRFIGTTYKYWDNGQVAEIHISTETSYFRKYITYYDPFGNSISETEFKQMWNCN